MTFARYGLLPPLLRALDRLGYRAPTPVQARAIPVVLSGRDLLAAARTGTGKTAGFALPVLQQLAVAGGPVASNSVRAVVLAPTRELAEQIHASIRDYGQNLPLRTLAVYGGVSLNPQMMRLRRGVDVVVATPGRLLDLHRQNAIRFHQVQTLVLDEADRMLDLGFSRDLNALFAALPRRRQTLLFSATFSDAIRALAADILRDPVVIDIHPRNATAPGVRQRVIPVDKKRKPALLAHLFKERRWGQVLVFVKSRKSAEQLAATLAASGIGAETLHGDKPQPARLRALERFKAAEARVLVATDVAARGLDIDALPLVINFDLPLAAEDYIHRIGRTGRAGARGEAISLVCADEVGLLSAIETLTRRVLPRSEEPGFEPDHRVPATPAGGQPLNKPKQPTPPKIPGDATPAKAGPGRAAAAPSAGRRDRGPAARKPGQHSRSR